MTTSVTMKPRYYETLLMLADGSSLAEIADEQSLSLNTVKNDLLVMRKMFAAKNNCNLIAIAYQKGILMSYGKLRLSNHFTTQTTTA